MIKHLLNETLEHWREERIPDGAGGWYKEWVKKGNVRGRMKPGTGFTETYRAATLEALMIWTLYVEPGQDIERDDQIRKGNEIWWKVIGTYEPSQKGYYMAVELENTPVRT